MLLGLPPYTYAFEPQAYGYADWREEADDPRGILATMERYARHDWSAYHFYSISTAVVESENTRLGVAAYLGEKEGILVAGNLLLQPAQEGTATVHLDKTPFGSGDVQVAIPPLQGWEWALVSFSF